jgi:hypothetical protein
VTVADLAAIPVDTLCRVVGAANGRHLAALARAQDDRPVVALQEAKSVGHEETFAADLHDHETSHRHIVRMSDAVGTRLRESHLRGRTVTVKVRFGDYSTITRSHTVPGPIDSPRAIGAVAGALLEGVDLSPGVRLLGVSMSALAAAVVEVHQLQFSDAGSGGDLGREPARGMRAMTGDVGGAVTGESAGPRAGEGGGGPTDPQGQGWDDVEAAVTAIRTRYGHESVGPATLIGRSGLNVKRRGDTQWGPSAPSPTAASVVSDDGTRRPKDS